MLIETIFLSLTVFVTCVFLGLSYRVDRRLSAVGTENLGKLPKISIIIPAHNKAKLIKRCLNSVLNSGYRNKEIVVVDDCSTDGTDKILNKIKGIRVIHNKKRLGKSQSLNNAAKKATSALILFLDADTFIGNDTIGKLVSSYMYYHKKEGKIGFISPKYNIIKG
ncbi:MAG TPA: glycosyltransferase family 2 protein, partial [archaeon]|nr:glycosyltransferase family 2 protein [archaeon]